MSKNLDEITKVPDFKSQSSGWQLSKHFSIVSVDNFELKKCTGHGPCTQIHFHMRVCQRFSAKSMLSTVLLPMAYFFYTASFNITTAFSHFNSYPV